MIYRADYSRPVDIERDAVMTLEFPLFGDNGAEIVAEATSTVRILKSDGTEALASAVVTLDGSTATLVLAGSEFTSEEFATGWQIEWTIDVSGEPARIYKQRALLVRQRLYPVINNETLLRRHPELEALYPSGQTSWDTAITSAWDTINTKLLQTNKRPSMILSPDSLAEAHIALALSRAFITCSTFTSAGRYEELADKYESRWELEWGTVQLYMDDGTGQASEKPTAAEPVVYLSGRGNRGFWGYTEPK